MNVQDFINKEEDIYRRLVDFIDENEDENNENFINFIKAQQIEKDISMLTFFILQISRLSNYHYRSPTFFDKIELILLTFKDDIINNFTNSEIFSFFKKNKRILLFLIQEKIITLDKSIVDTIMNIKYFKIGRYQNYFITEIKPFIENKQFRKIETFNRQSMNIEKGKSIGADQFNELKKLGENNGYICELTYQTQLLSLVEMHSKIVLI